MNAYGHYSLTLKRLCSMTKNEIINHYYNERCINDTLLSVCPAYLREDMKQHLFLIICNKDEDFILKLHISQEFCFYSARIIVNSVRGNGRSDFAKQMKETGSVCYESTFEIVHFKPDQEHEEMAAREAKEIKMQQCEAAAQELYWYNQAMLKQYIELGSYRKVAQFNGLPTMSIYHAVKEAKEQIKKKLC